MHDKKEASGWWYLMALGVVVTASLTGIALFSGRSTPVPSSPTVVSMKVPPIPAPASTPPAPVTDPAAETASSGNGAETQPAVAQPAPTAADLPTGQTPSMDDQPAPPATVPNGLPQVPSAADGINEQPSVLPSPSPPTADTLPAEPAPASSGETTAVSPEMAASEPATQPASNPIGPSGSVPMPEKAAAYTVQIGVFHNRAYAEAMMGRLNHLGYPAHTLEATDKRQRPLYQVRFGAYATLGEAVETMKRFRKKEGMDAVVVRFGAQ